MIKPKHTNKMDTDRNESPEKCLAENVRQSMENYFEDLDGHHPSDLYDLFMQEVEKPFFEVVMSYTKGNISHASKMLGLNRVTLRNRLKKYNLD